MATMSTAEYYARLRGIPAKKAGISAQRVTADGDTVSIRTDKLPADGSDEAIRAVAVSGVTQTVPLGLTDKNKAEGITSKKASHRSEGLHAQTSVDLFFGLEKEAEKTPTADAGKDKGKGGKSA